MAIGYNTSLKPWDHVSYSDNCWITEHAVEPGEESWLRSTLSKYRDVTLIDTASMSPNPPWFGEESRRRKNEKLFKKVIFNDPATIIYWSDGTKTVVKAMNEEFDPEKGLAMAISKKMLGNKGNYYEIFKKYIPEESCDLKE